MLIDVAAFDAMPLVTEPFPHLIVPGFVSSSALSQIGRDFPEIGMAGLFPPDAFPCGPAFSRLLAEFEGPELRAAVARKFDLDLSGHPTLTTLRDRARARDGQIHADASFKMVTLLLYLNEDWATDTGRLRLLRSPTDLEDYVSEVPPDGGTLLAFRCTPNAWHGHKPFEGMRRAIQMNYVADAEAGRREMARHRLSARMKKVTRALGFGESRKSA